MLLSKWYVSEAVDAYGTACTCGDVDTTPALGILHTGAPEVSKELHSVP